MTATPTCSDARRQPVRRTARHAAGREADARAGTRPHRQRRVARRAAAASRRSAATAPRKFALVGLTEALRTELVGERHPRLAGACPASWTRRSRPKRSATRTSPMSWPEQLNMPPSWVVWCIFLAIRFRLAEIAVPPGSALLEKLAALAPGRDRHPVAALGDSAPRSARASVRSALTRRHPHHSDSAYLSRALMSLRKPFDRTRGRRRHAVAGPPRETECAAPRAVASRSRQRWRRSTPIRTCA